MTSKSKSKQEEALQFLDDLDSLNPVAEPARRSAAPATGSAGDPADVLAFIDEITQKSSEPTRPTPSHIERYNSRPSTPSLRKSTERVKVGAHPSSSTTSLVASSSVSSPAATTEDEPAPAPSSSLWGWGSVWTSASTAYQQARSVVDEQVKNLPKNEHISKLGEGVLEYAKTAQLDKLGSSVHEELMDSTLIHVLQVKISRELGSLH